MLVIAAPRAHAVDVFISHANNDKATADAICAELEASGVRCWIAPRDIVPGKPWSEAIIDGICNSRVMVVVFSSAANVSRQVQREIERAVSRGLTIVPFRIEDVPMSKSMEYFLSSPHWLDATTSPLEQHLLRLVTTIGHILSGEPESTARSPQQQDHAAQVIADSPGEHPVSPELELALRHTQKTISKGVGCLFWLWCVSCVVALVVPFFFFHVVMSVVVTLVYAVVSFVILVAYFRFRYTRAVTPQRRREIIAIAERSGISELELEKIIDEKYSVLGFWW